MGCNLSVLLRCQYQVTNHWDLLPPQNPSLNARIFCRGVIIIIVFDDCYIIVIIVALIISNLFVTFKRLWN